MSMKYKESDVVNYLYERNVIPGSISLDIVLALCDIKGSLEEGCSSYMDGKVMDIAFFKSKDKLSEMIKQALFRYNNNLPFKCLSNNKEEFLDNLINVSGKDKFISLLNQEGWYISNNIAVCISN